MADIDDRWYRTDRSTGERSPTARHGTGKRWDVRWRDGERQRHKAFERNADAKRFLAKITADLDAGTYVDPALGRTTVKAYAEQWLAAQTSDPSTREAVALRLRLHVLPTLGDYQLRALRPSTVRAWVRGLQAELAPSYVRVIHASLSAVLRAAVEDGLLARSPASAVSARPPAAPQAKVVPWTASQVAAVTGALPARLEATAVVAAGLGLRQGEAFGLAVGDVDFLRKVAHVRRQVRIVGGRLVFAPPKTGKTRDVPLASTVALALARHLERFPARPVTLPWREPAGKPTTAELVFTTETGALDRNGYNDAWRAARSSAGIPAGRENGLHALRHFFASSLLQQGVNVRAVSEYLGHTDPGFTLRVYGHVMPAAEDQARRAVDASLDVADAGAPDVRQGGG